MLRSFLGGLIDEPGLIHVEHLEARDARFAGLERPLPGEVTTRLGIEKLWCHQARAIDLARTGHCVAIATGTASGKSLCYQAPIAEAVTEDPSKAGALMVFPTKALAQDQLRSIGSLDIPGLVAATYDGDTDQTQRAWVRRHANVILTNPEMLHMGILPAHEQWAGLLSHLRYVVIDELHTMRGVFGTHVAHLIRRLRRLCAHYGADPVFIFASATIGEPGKLASELCGLPVMEVTDDGSPRGERLFVLWNPCPVDDDESESVSANKDAARLTGVLVRTEHRTITFCRSRKGTEVVAADVRRQLGKKLASAVRAYRSGYLSEERREIEHLLATGKLRAVVATSALELGVDIGGLDACVLNGFPGTIASMWQQAGRVGRDQRSSIAVLVGGDDQLDQWLMTHPGEVFTRSPEPAVINTANPFVLDPHLSCAAYEIPLTHDDERWWPDLLDDGIRRLVVADKLRIRTRTTGSARTTSAVWSARGRPAAGVGLRSGTTDQYRIVTPDDALVGTVDGARAFALVHPGAIYLHQGQAYRVLELDTEDLVALIEPTDGGEYTQTRSETDITILEEIDNRTRGHARFSLGRVLVRSKITGYRRFEAFTGELIGTEELFLPPSELDTTGFWWTIPHEIFERADIATAAIPGTLHALEHAAIGILPLFTICDRWDVGGVSTALQADTGAPTIVIHDAYPGGAGVAELGFGRATDILAAAADVIAGCRCIDGCPSCVQSPKCGNGNEPLDKGGALALAMALIEQH